ncbi:MAG: hypothetical protein HFH49_13120 [Lachnospiraceae bacterium]|nr:hypothetical protein [Lachnospiraceae bacterium]
MMEFEEFTEKTARELEKSFEGKAARLREVLKNNGVRRHGIILYSPGETAFPTVYLEEYYEEYRKGKGFPEVIREIGRDFRRHRPPENVSILSGFTRWCLAREKLDIKVINYKANQELLEALPHRRFLDLAEVYCYMENLGGGSRGTVLVDKSHLKLWGISQEELEECAHICHKRRKSPQVRSMREILPSSVFEVLAVPAGRERPEELAGMVREVNHCEVAAEERLSESVYLYSRESGEIRIAWEGRQGKEADRE